MEPIKPIFVKFNMPWNFNETAEEYVGLFKNKGFKVPFSQIKIIETYHKPEEVCKIFCSGAVAGYLNKTYYDCEFDENYTKNFFDNIRKAFAKQAQNNGKVKLVFNRMFLSGIKK
ncbi:MAG: hypothetical protein LBR98_09590 [Syntrophomonadaceae bacterium]|nr:hypothetical protein [Syntrophomonadaceae bacterium]